MKKVLTAAHKHNCTEEYCFKAFILPTHFADRNRIL